MSVLTRELGEHDTTGDLARYHEWVFLGERRWLDSLARRNPRGNFRGFLVYVCNNPHCTAEVLVSEEDIGELLAPHLPEVP